MKKTVSLLITITLLISTAMSSDKKLICSVERLNQAFHLKENSITFYDIENQDGRSIASINKLRTIKQDEGITKIIIYNNLRYSFHIENQNNFSNHEDYLTIHSNKGHEIIYPIDCQWR